MADAYSKMMEIFPVSSTSASVTIEKLRMIFATHGLPEMAMTDNISGFKNEKLGDFMQNNNIWVLKPAPFHVHNFQHSLKKMLETTQPMLCLKH